jgi:uncharacterized membrane protein (DUF485 family)
MMDVGKNLLLGGSIAVLVLYFLSLGWLAFQWNAALATGVIGIGIVSWGFMLSCLLERLRHQG